DTVAAHAVIEGLLQTASLGGGAIPHLARQLVDEARIDQARRITIEQRRRRQFDDVERRQMRTVSRGEVGGEVETNGAARRIVEMHQDVLEGHVVLLPWARGQ